MKQQEVTRYLTTESYH